MKEKLKDNKGITLVALVITIVVLLILAGVTIGTFTSSNLIEKSRLAKNEAENAIADENSVIENYLAFVDDNTGDSGEQGKILLKEEYTLTDSVNKEKISELGSYLINNNFAYSDDDDYYFDIYNYSNDEEEVCDFFSISLNSQYEIEEYSYHSDREELRINMYMIEGEDNRPTYKWVKEIEDESEKGKIRYEEVTTFPKIKISDIETYLEVSIDENNWVGSKEDFMTAVVKILNTFSE